VLTDDHSKAAIGLPCEVLYEPTADPQDRDAALENNRFVSKGLELRRPRSRQVFESTISFACC
jgi:hypothetical protein